MLITKTHRGSRNEFSLWEFAFEIESNLGPANDSLGIISSLTDLGSSVLRVLALTFRVLALTFEKEAKGFDWQQINGQHQEGH